MFEAVPEIAVAAPKTEAAPIVEQEEHDPVYDDAMDAITKEGSASISLLQRKLGIGYGRAARIIDTMEKEGIVGPSHGPNKPRELLKTDTSKREVLSESEPKIEDMTLEQIREAQIGTYAEWNRLNEKFQTEPTRENYEAYAAAAAVHNKLQDRAEALEAASSGEPEIVRTYIPTDAELANMNVDQLNDVSAAVYQEALKWQRRADNNLTLKNRDANKAAWKRYSDVISNLKRYRDQLYESTTQEPTEPVAEPVKTIELKPQRTVEKTVSIRGLELSWGFNPNGKSFDFVIEGHGAVDLGKNKEMAEKRFQYAVNMAANARDTLTSDQIDTLFDEIEEPGPSRLPKEGAPAELLHAWDLSMERFDGDEEAVKDSLISFGVPKKVMDNLTSLKELSDMANKAGRFSPTNKKVRDALLKFVEETNIQEADLAREEEDKKRKKEGLNPLGTVESVSRKSIAHKSMEARRDTPVTPRYDSTYTENKKTVVESAEDKKRREEQERKSKVKEEKLWKQNEPLPKSTEGEGEQTFFGKETSEALRAEPERLNRTEIVAGMNIAIDWDDAQGAYTLDVPNTHEKILIGRDKDEASKLFDLTSSKLFDLSLSGKERDEDALDSVFDNIAETALDRRHAEDYAGTVGEDVSVIESVRDAFETLSSDEREDRGFPASWDEIINPPKPSFLKRTFGNPLRDQRQLFAKLKAFANTTETTP